MATIDDLVKLEFKVGTILEAEEIEGSEKLLKLKVDLGVKEVAQKETEESENAEGEEIASEAAPRNDDDKKDIRQVLSGIKLYYKPEDLKGKQFVFVTNLEPRKMMGLESQAMIMAADAGEDVVLLVPQKEVPTGSKIR